MPMLPYTLDESVKQGVAVLTLQRPEAGYALTTSSLRVGEIA